MFIKKISITLLFLSFCSYVSAAVTERDLVQGSNDKFITYDSSNNLEWLDLTYTQGRSVYEIQNNWGGLLDLGFRYATLKDLEHLAGSFGLKVNQNYTTASYKADSDTIFSVAATESLIDLVHKVGVTLVSSNQGVIQQEWAYGMFAFETPDELLRFPYMGIGYQSTSRIDSIVYTTISGSGGVKNGYGEFGSWLVRNAPSPVPEPHESLLLIAGLILIVGCKKRIV